MPLYKPKTPVCVAISCSCVALVFQLVAVVATGWMKWDGDEIGLFRRCNFFGCKTVDTHEAYLDWRKVCQAFSICALVTIFGNFVLGVQYMRIADTQMLTLPTRAFSVVAAVCLAMEVTLFAGKTSDVVKRLESSYGYSFYLSAVAGLLSVVSAILN